MKEKLYTNHEVANFVENEGLSYTIQHYLRHDKIKDKNLAAKWKAAEELLNEIEKDLGLV